MAVPMANGPPFATLNHVAADLGIPNESEPLRVGISYPISTAARVQRKSSIPTDGGAGAASGGLDRSRSRAIAAMDDPGGL